MAKPERSGLKIFLLLILLIIVLLGTIYWFNFIGLINIQRSYFKIYGKIPGLKQAKEIVDPFLLEKEYLDKLKISFDSRAIELDKREEKIALTENDMNEQINKLEEKEKALSEKEKNINQKLKSYEDYKNNIRKQADYFMSMPPEKSSQILSKMAETDILKVVDVLRMIDEIAAENDQSSLVPVILMNMDEKLAAEINYLMIEGANTLPGS